MISTKREAHHVVTTDLARLDIRVIGKRPKNEPYVWIGDTETELCLDLIDEKAMRKLHRALGVALGSVSGGET